MLCCVVVVSVVRGRGSFEAVCTFQPRFHGVVVEITCLPPKEELCCLSVFGRAVVFVVDVVDCFLLPIPVFVPP